MQRIEAVAPRQHGIAGPHRGRGHEHDIADDHLAVEAGAGLRHQHRRRAQDQGVAGQAQAGETLAQENLGQQGGGQRHAAADQHPAMGGRRKGKTARPDQHVRHPGPARQQQHAVEAQPVERQALAQQHWQQDQAGGGKAQGDQVGHRHGPAHVGPGQHGPARPDGDAQQREQIAAHRHSHVRLERGRRIGKRHDTGPEGDYAAGS
nr:hypothetical protein [Oleomonas cavernae]